MSEDRELTRLENEWKNRLDRFTSPEPTREQTFNLIEKLKNHEVKPVDLRVELEARQAAQPALTKIANLFLSQWSFYGTTSWLLTGAVMLLLTIMISVSAGSEMTGFMTWIKWITLVVIAIMGYAFRSKNEGNDIIEKLSYHTLAQQMFARFIIVMGLQLALIFSLGFFILGKASSLLYISGSFTPIFFFGVIGFISTMWLGQKVGVLITLLIWLIQLIFDQQLKSASMFQLPWNEHFYLINAAILALSSLLLCSLLLKNGRSRDFK
ncbi:hypothetical protein [Paenibacillus eucommiae]|uniref:Permease n=1 Tax=Paenibacillus eucommiae TaxID=1355755 RepID=A0ABS4IQ99_9BACL|nr:hypothetical protein [Paenibacillus eucommiae]MBP1989705.1 hypothetical protein [Paenibacillus eucommiae]